MIYFTSDQHFRHHNIIKYSKRPFSSIEEMEDKMISAWNNIVEKEDTVYFLGDFCFEKLPSWTELLNQLNGDIVLIKGNHDRRQVVEQALDNHLIKELYLNITTLTIDDITLILSHKPLVIVLGDNEFNIHGHIHELDEDDPHKINVCVDSELAKAIDKPFGTPISMQELLDHINSIQNELSTEHTK